MCHVDGDPGARRLRTEQALLDGTEYVRVLEEISAALAGDLEEEGQQGSHTLEEEGFGSVSEVVR